MNVLALENSTSRCSVALLRGEAPPILFEHQNDGKHSGAFFQSLERLSDQLRTLEIIIVGLGPGSYAGVRIAIATAIGLQAARDATLLGWPSICAIEDAPNEYGIIGDARRDSFYFARIAANEIVDGIHLDSEEQLQNRLETSERGLPIFSSEKLPQFPRAEVRYPSALLLGKLAERGMVRSQETPLEPIYLRAPHITIPNDKRKSSLLG